MIPAGNNILLTGNENQNFGATASWLMLIDSSGEVVWSKESTQAFIRNLTGVNGSVVMGGSTNSFDLFTAKMDPMGNLLWKKFFGDNGFQAVAAQVSQTSDGGYFIAGQTNHFGGGSEADLWALKLDANGNTVWQRAFDAEGNQDLIIGGEPTNDNGYILAGFRNFKQGPSHSLWMIKLNASGLTVWEKIYEISSLAEGNSIFETSDGGFIVSAKRIEPGKGYDLWILKLDASGKIVWQKGLGGEQEDFGDVYPVADGYVVAGTTYSYGAGNSDVWVVKMDLGGNIVWQKAFGGADYENGSAFTIPADGRYWIAGRTRSFGADGFDLWLLNLDQNGEPEEGCSLSQNTSAVPYITAGTAQSFTSASPAINIASSDSDISTSGWTPLIATQCCSISLPADQLPVGALNQSYEATLATDEGLGLTYAISSGSLPSGLSLDSASGLISGVPSTEGVFNFEITATDNFNCAASHSYSIQIVQCVFCDDFEDGVLSNGWSYPKGVWVEQDGELSSSAVRKSSAYAVPVFAGCNLCNVRTAFITQGGDTSRLWIVAWRQDDNNQIELLIKEGQDRWILRQRLNGKIVAKKKWIQAIEPGIRYDIAILNDGNQLSLQINGSDAVSLTPASTQMGTIGFQIKATSANFEFIIVD
jgi:hypothetical protein